ncbi:MAG: hypothetical protein L7F77_07555 [Candidatus Magnetominusculus sp. LBB02]|nr:hypothetical protein [Candidatus Magnetominusculus sp. LBB02]
MKYLGQINVLNIFLIIALLLMGGYEYYSFNRKDNVKVSALKKKRHDLHDVKLNDSIKLLARGDYMVITEKNLFHPERKPIKAQADAPPADLIVYGTIVGATNTAFVEDKKNPYSTQGRGQRQRMLHEGDTISGYNVVRITPEFVEFSKNDTRLLINVIDFEKKKTRQQGDSTRTTAVTAPQPSPVHPQPSQILPPPSLPMPNPVAPQNPAAINPMPMMPATH